MADTADLAIQRRKEILNELLDRWAAALRSYEAAERMRESATAIEREASNELHRIVALHTECTRALARMMADDVAPTT